MDSKFDFRVQVPSHLCGVPKSPFVHPEAGLGGRGHFRGDAVNFAVMRPDAQLAGFQRVPVKNKTRFYAGNLVPLGPLSTIGVGGTDA